MKTISQFVYTILFLSITCLLPAQNVTINRAMNVAKNHLSIVGGDKLKSAGTSRVRPQHFSVLSSDSDADTLMFILNDTINNNFVIVAADERVWPIIGYSLEGEYSENNQPPAFSEWIENRKKEIEYVRQNEIQPDIKVSQQWDNLSSTNTFSVEETSSVEPLLQAKWGQGCYYNSMCPADAAGPCGHVVTGCVATAMAQIMKYWNFPRTGIGSNTYTHSIYGQLTVDFGSTSYLWSQMSNSLNEENNAVATLMYHCGVAVYMDYDITGSGAGSPRDAMIDYFNYSPDAQYQRKSNFEESDWINLIKSELELKRPVWYAGSNANVGHAFVCDGYQNQDYFHFNWGWGGSQDGYFYIGDQLSFNSNQAAVVKIFPTSLPDGHNGFYVSKNAVTISVNGESDSVIVASSANWTAVSDQTWLILNQESGSPGTTKLILTANENLSGLERLANVVISVNGYGSQTIRINQPAKINVKAGELQNILAGKLSTISNMALSGVIDASDFKTMRDKMPLLTKIDLSEVTIVEYTGNEGTYGAYNMTYLANTIPAKAFKLKNLVSIILPSNITDIDIGSFQDCSGLEKIDIPLSVISIKSEAFYNCTGLKTIFIPSSVTSIGNDAFGSQSGLISVDQNNPNYSSFDGVLFDKNKTTLISCPVSKTGSFNIPSTVTLISKRAFYACEKLVSVILPDALTTIGDKAFMYCSALNGISIPVFVNSIGYMALIGINGSINVSENNQNYCGFEGVLFNKTKTLLIQCPTSKTGSYTIPSSVNSIGTYAFFNCYGLNSVIIPSSASFAGDYAFVYCGGLKTVSIPSSFNSIGTGLFYNCSALSSIVMPSTIISIGHYSFNGCKSLESVSIPSSVTFIGSNAFSGCKGLSSIYAFPIPPVNLETSDDVFKDINKTTCKLFVPFGSSGIYSESNQWSDFTNREEMPGLFVSPGLVVMGADEDTASIRISSSSNWSQSFDQEWLKVGTMTGGTGIFDISLTATAFENTGKRTANVTVIATGHSPQTVTVEQYGKTNVTAGNLSTIIGAKLTTTNYLVLSGTIDARDFKTMRDEMPQLSKIDLKDVTIDEYTGEGGTYNSVSRTYPANTIPECAFFNTTTITPKYILQSVVLPLTATSIGSSAFSYCSGLASIKITDSIVTIGSYAFLACSGLPKLVIPSSVTSIEHAAFEYCAANITVDEKNKNYSALEGVLFNKTKTELIYCPVSKKGSYTIPSQVTSIGHAAFGNCKELISVSIPSSVTSIGTNAFIYCSKLNSIYVNTVFPVDLTNSFSVFTDVNLSSCSLYVPFGTSGTYAVADQWRDFKNIYEMPGIFPSQQYITFGAVGGKEEITISSSVNWNISSDQEWLTVSQVSGTSGVNSISLIAANYADDSKRIATVTITAINLAPVTISINQFGKTEITAGNLKELLGSNLSTISHLTLSGTIDARDFKTMRDEMPQLEVIDLSQVTIASYYGTEGTYPYGSYSFPADGLPINAFYNPITGVFFSKIMSVTLPVTITSIENNAFFNCSSLNSIYSHLISPINLSNNCNVFSNVNKTNCTLYVPFGTKQDYQAANQWKDFLNIVEMPGITISANTLSMGANAGDTAVTVATSVAWTATSDQGWLTVSPSSGIAGIKTFNIAVSPNSGINIRTGTITISATGLESKIIKVTQYGRVEVTAGNLKTILSGQLENVTNLTVYGTIDARDFRTMRDEMPKLKVIDLSQATINGYTGAEGTYRIESGGYEYPPNEIPDYAFYNQTTVKSKTGLVSIILPNSTASVGDNSFYSCTGLTSVNIPSVVILIGNYTFYNCASLKTVNIPSSVKTIGNYAFSYCKALTSLSLPSSISTIGYGAFYYCIGLTVLTTHSIVPVNLDSAPNVFYNINKTSCILYVPFGTKPYYLSASQWKDFLNIVEMPGLFLSVNSVDMGANSGTAKVEITSSSSWTAFSDQEWLTASPASGASGAGTITFSATANLTTSARTATVTVSATGLGSKTIFVTQYGKVEVTPGNLKQIIAGQLAIITNLTLTGTIDARDFKTMRDEMPLLTSVDLSGVSVVAYSGEDGTSPYNTDYPADAIPEQAFFNSNTYQGKPLKNIIFPLSLISVGNSAFQYCSQLTTATIPEGVVSIGSSAFISCQKLVSVSFPSSVNNIGSVAFSNCSKLITVNIPSSLNSIEYGLFRGCSSLISITIPSSVTSIGSNAFEGCIAITDINIPSSVISIGNNAFSNCSGLFNVDADNPNYSGSEGVLYNKTQTTLIQCPVSKTGVFIITTKVKTISTNAFYNCKALTSINIPSSVTTIESGAFYYCTGLTTINIPASVKTIESYAFQNCNNVTSVSAYSINPVNLGSSYSVFYGINKTKAILYVPFGTKVLYAASNQWQDFSNIVEMPGIFLSENSLGMGANSGTKNVAITSSVSWTAVSDQSWLTINPASGASGASSITLSAAANLTTSERMAVVTISATGLDPKSILVTQYGKVEVNAGNLITILSRQLETVTNLTLSGTIDARDFKTMRDEMPQLTDIDLSHATIVSYYGSEGTYPTDWGSYDYPANEIPVFAFYNPNTGISKISLESIILPEITKVIGDQAFYNCEHLSSIDLTSSIRSIRSQAFYNCKELTTISIPASVNLFGDEAYYNSESITTIHALGITPVDLSKVYNVFYGIDKITCILYVPFGTKPDYQAADQWKDFLNIVEMPGLFLSASSVSMGAKAGSTEVRLASSASWSASSDRSWLTVSPSSGLAGSKTLNISVTANMAENSRTATVTISATGLESKTIIVTHYGRVAVTAGNLKTILSGKLETVTNLTLSGTIDVRDFRTMRDEMPQLTDIDLSYATIVSYYGSEGTYPTDWGSYDYPANEIPVYAFYNPGTGISKLSLESIILPEFTTAIGDHAFNSCIQLSSIEINTNLTSIRSMAFYNCTQLTSLDFKAKLTSIGSWAFSNCTGLFSLSIPESVNGLGDGAFYYSGNITSIYVSDIVPIDLSNTYDVFGGIDKTTCILYVPAGSLSLYQAASQWQDFLNIVEINHSVYQSISLSPGWNIMSINVMPEETNLNNILNPLITGGKLKKVMDETGAVIEDWGEINGGWQNTIGEIKNTEGYKINVNSDVMLEITGMPLLLPFDIQLTEGWNIISWPSSVEQDGMDVFRDLILAGKLKKVMDEGGYIIEDWGVANGSWQNFIGNLKPGEGYKVNVTSDCILTIKTGTKSNAIISKLLASTHFIPAYKGNGTDHMNINLVNLVESGIMEGDEIGIFDGDICVGSAQVSNSKFQNVKLNSSISIPVSAADGIESKNGYSEGNLITLKLFRNGKEYVLTIEPLNNSTPVFEKGSSLFAQLALPTGIEGIIKGGITGVKVYPNPFSDEVTIEINLKTEAQTQVEVLNQLGQTVKMISKKQLLPGGLHKLTWNGRNTSNGEVAPGIYHLRIEIDNVIVHRKIILSK